MKSTRLSLDIPDGARCPSCLAHLNVHNLLLFYGVAVCPACESAFGTDDLFNTVTVVRNYLHVRDRFGNRGLVFYVPKQEPSLPPRINPLSDATMFDQDKVFALQGVLHETDFDSDVEAQRQEAAGRRRDPKWQKQPLPTDFRPAVPDDPEYA